MSLLEAWQTIRAGWQTTKERDVSSLSYGTECVKEFSSDWVNETMMWKVGRATQPQFHSSTMLTDVSCLLHQVQPPLRPLGFLVNASVVARSCFRDCSKLAIIKRRVMKNLLEEALNRMN